MCRNAVQVKEYDFDKSFISSYLCDVHHGELSVNSSSQYSTKQTTYVCTAGFYVQDILYCRSTLHSLFIIIVKLYSYHKLSRLMYPKIVVLTWQQGWLLLVPALCWFILAWHIFEFMYCWGDPLHRYPDQLLYLGRLILPHPPHPHLHGKLIKFNYSYCSIEKN